MRQNKILLASLVILMFSFSACTGKNEKVAKEANAEIVNDSESLSSDLVNNPIASDVAAEDLTNAGKLVFIDTIHDFGNLKDGEIIQYEFEYKNEGKRQIIITEAKGSCGCTVPEYDTKPIAPGATGKMKVTFNSKGKIGYNEKNIQISTNGYPQKYKLTILALVD